VDIICIAREERFGLLANVECMHSWSSGDSLTIRWTWRIGQLQWDRHLRRISSFLVTLHRVFNRSYQLNSTRSGWPEIVLLLLLESDTVARMLQRHFAQSELRRCQEMVMLPWQYRVGMYEISGYGWPDIWLFLPFGSGSVQNVEQQWSGCRN